MQWHFNAMQGQAEHTAVVDEVQKSQAMLRKERGEIAVAIAILAG
ncbi:hypothetical protein [Leptolyngbya sp. AN02str]